MRKHEKGSSTVEFAASVLLVILMFLGMPAVWRLPVGILGG